MQELRLVAVSEDGTYLVLASAGRGTRFTLPVDDRLRAAVRGQFSRLGQYEIEVENPLRPKEIQARIRSGETAESIAQAAGIPIERVRWFEGPVLQEREYMAQQAQRASVRLQGDAAPGPVLGDVVAERIGSAQLESGDASWDSWKREDNTWQIRLSFRVMGEEHVAHWVYEPRRRSVTPYDEEAVRFSSGADSDEPPDLGPGSANVTPFAPRRPGAREVPQAPPPTLEETAAPAAGPAPAAAPRRTRVPITAERMRQAESAPPRPAPEYRYRPEAAPPPAPAPPGRAERPEPLSPPAAAQQPSAPGQLSPHPDPPLPAAASGAPQPPRRKGRGRRASVPSWDEIMFGSKKSE
ncbi:septation protein SepH [Actinorugispora endophytica]|uniref:DUF3071 family protein n=1 Tax=Actinorugispora endophytica TaxID=1605990 RepID=A0A4R6UR88_9ACTN|nr:septation protein SepH [Actinorugispora endophytica]TDQ49561.1 DUF3071 family protein [Actinorugispora endophytica]